jgi:hypothetical protein
MAGEAGEGFWLLAEEIAQDFTDWVNFTARAKGWGAAHHSWTSEGPTAVVIFVDRAGEPILLMGSFDLVVDAMATLRGIRPSGWPLPPSLEALL